MNGIERLTAAGRQAPGRISVWLTLALCLAVVVGGTPGLVSGAGAPASPAWRAKVAQEGLSGDVIVVLDDSASFRAAEEAVVDVAVEATGEAPVHVYDSAITGFSATLSAAEVQELAAEPSVVAIIPDTPIYAAAQALPTGVDRIDADQNPIANINGSDERVNADVAVLDAGIGATSDINLAGGVDCSYSDTGDFSDTSTGHGTHVAGIIGALDNGIGVVGVAPGARIWAVKILALDSRGLLSGRLSDLICGLEWVLENSGTIDVVNMSITGEGSDGTCSDGQLRELVCAVSAAGVTMVAAAGNDNANVADTIPATFPEVIAVSGFSDTDGAPGNDVWWSVSPTVGSNFGADIDIAAPAVNILSLAPGGGTATKSGTSMASAHVSGAVALSRAGGGDIFASSRAQNSSGGFTGDPDGIPEPVLCVGPCGSAQSAAMTLDKTRSTVNVNLNVTLSGFPASTSVTVAFVGTSYPSSATVQTNGSGAATARVKVPATPAGPYTVRATSGSTVVNRTFTVAPRIKVIPASAGRGDTVDVSLRGYARRESVRIRWLINGSWVQVATVTTSNSGSANVDVPVPSNAQSGSNSVRGDGTAQRAQTNAFTVTGAALRSAAADAPRATPDASPVAGTPIASPVDDGTPEATATVEPTVEPTPEPTATEVPTETPVPTEIPTEIPTETPTPEPTPLAIVADTSSDPAVSGWVTYDNDELTYWEVAAPIPISVQAAELGTPETVIEPAVGPDGLPLPAASLVLDLGVWSPVSKVRWVYAVEGLADDLRIEVSDDGIFWTTVTYPGQVGNALPGEWIELALPPNTYGGRYVRFAFENPNGDLTLGGIAELEIWP